MNSSFSYICRLFVAWVVLCLVFPDAGQGQEQYAFFYGKVLDQLTKKGLPNVNLSIAATSTGTVSGKKGDFSFFVDSVPCMLMVSHVGYKTKAIYLDNTSYSLTLYLEPAAEELQEVEIKARQQEFFFKDELYSVRDYEIDSGNIYLLVYKTRLLYTEILCKKPNGDTLARSPVIRFTPNRLFRDCMGYMHVLSNDSGFQINRVGTCLELTHPVGLKRFDNVLKDCIVSTPETFYFQKVVDKGQQVEYYGIDRKTLIRKNITSVTDEKKARLLRRNPGDLGLLWSTKPPDSREDFVTWNYVHKILYRPVKTALFRIGNYFCIFNTPEKQVEFYDMQGNYSYKLLLYPDQIHEGRWTQEVLIDEATTRVYTTFLRSGICTLYRIDLNNGNLKRVMELPHPFPQKIKIWNGDAYYLYDVPGTADNKMLFRQGL